MTKKGIAIATPLRCWPCIQARCLGSCAAYTILKTERPWVATLGLFSDSQASGASQAFRWRDQTITDHRSIASRLPRSEPNCLCRLSRATAREQVDCKPGLQVAGLASANLHGDRWHHRQGTVPCEAVPLHGAPKPKQKEVNPGLDSALGLDLKFQRHSRLARSPTLERAWPP